MIMKVNRAWGDTDRHARIKVINISSLTLIVFGGGGGGGKMIGQTSQNLVESTRVLTIITLPS